MGQYERLSRTLIHEGKILNVYQDRMKLPNGNEADWDFIGHHGAAAFVAETEDHKIVMVRQYRNALERYTIEIPAGGINAGESFEDAAIRELQEETGYQPVRVCHLLDLYTTVAFCNEKIGIYCGTVTRKQKQHLDEDEFVEIVLYSMEELLNMILEGTIQDSKTISALLAYNQFKDEKQLCDRGVTAMNQEAFDGIIRYIDHMLDNDRTIFRQVFTGKEYEAEMLTKALTVTSSFLKDDMDFSGAQVKALLKHIFEFPYE